MNIRHATASDLDALNALVERAYRGDSAKQGWTHEADLLGGQRTDPEALAEMIADRAQYFLIAEQDGEAIGCICVADKGGGLAYVGLVTVDPLRQGGGFGRELLAAGEDEARAADLTRAEMTVIKQRPELIAWYERRGYTLTGQTRPFPHSDPRFGLPKRDDLIFVVLEKPL